MHLVFWQNILSPHQAPFMRALPKLGHEVTVVATETMTPDRLALGWKVPDLGQARVVIGPDEAEIRRLVETSPSDSIHVMAGARWSRLGNQATQVCLASKRRMGIISEAPDPRGLAFYGRWAKYTLERFTKGAHYDFILAMGEMGVRWFRSCHYPGRVIFPFTYVTEPPAQLCRGCVERKSSILFVGRFIPLKGLDLLLRAFSGVSSKQAELRLLGEGPERRRLESLVQNLRIYDRVLWLPQTDSAGVQAEMEKTDTTVLPSRKDGWGAVVNESLMAGTPVICSDACGAADLIRHPWLGTVFRACRADELTKALDHWINLGPRSESERNRIRDWANCISGESIAKYLIAILEHVYSAALRPSPPWRASAPQLASTRSPLAVALTSDL